MLYRNTFRITPIAVFEITIKNGKTFRLPNLFSTYAFLPFGKQWTANSRQMRSSKRCNADLPVYYIRVILERHDSSELLTIVQSVGCYVWGQNHNIHHAADFSSTRTYKQSRQPEFFPFDAHLKNSDRCDFQRFSVQCAPLWSASTDMKNRGHKNLVRGICRTRTNKNHSNRTLEKEYHPLNKK